MNARACCKKHLIFTEIHSENAILTQKSLVKEALRVCFSGVKANCFSFGRFFSIISCKKAKTTGRTFVINHVTHLLQLLLQCLNAVGLLDLETGKAGELKLYAQGTAGYNDGPTRLAC